MKTFHTFGDSHCFIRMAPIRSKKFNLKLHYIGPVLLYSIGNEKLNRLNIKDDIFKVKDGDYISFHFGEIDCRCHINKYITKDINYEKIINRMIEKYFK